MTTEYKTTWSKEKPPYGAFDDFIILKSINDRSKLFIRPEEFDFLMNQMMGNLNTGKSKYVQVLSEWNECKGFNGTEGKESKVVDIEELMISIDSTKGTTGIEFGKILESDRLLILQFLKGNRSKGILISKV